MSHNMTLRYITELSPGRYEYRRRVPKAVKDILGKNEWKRVIEARTAADLARGYARVEAEFQKDTAEAPIGTTKAPQMTPREAAQAAQDAINAVRGEVLQMLSEVTGPMDEEDRQDVLAEDLERRGMYLQYRALVQPVVKLPEPTLGDALRLYVKEKLGGGTDPKHQAAMNRLARVMKKASDAGLNGDRLLGDIDRETAKAVRDLMLRAVKKDGGTISPDSVQRDLTALRSVISHGIKEFGLKLKVANHFTELDIPGTGVGAGGPTATWQLKEGLSEEIITQMNKDLPDFLQPIWALLNGTGCRLAEITGLRVDDLVMDAPVPFLRVQFNDVRRLKNTASIRSIPLLNDTLDATRKALSVLPADATALFPRYARHGGPDAASKALMLHLRKITKDPKATVHSLRHSMKGRLLRAAVGKQAQDLLLGHAGQGEGERYGSEADRLVVVEKALRAVEALGGR
jgi:integrase